MQRKKSKTPHPPTGSSAAGKARGGATPEIANIEMRGDRLKVFSLHTLLTNKKNPETRPVAKLGDVLVPWFEKVISKPAEKMDGITELWLQHVPAKLLARSRLVGFNRGTLTVSLDSTTVRAELDAQLRGGLLRQLQTESRGSLYRVKTCVERAESAE